MIILMAAMKELVPATKWPRGLAASHSPAKVAIAARHITTAQCTLPHCHIAYKGLCTLHIATFPHCTWPNCTMHIATLQHCTLPYCNISNFHIATMHIAHCHNVHCTLPPRVTLQFIPIVYKGLCTLPLHIKNHPANCLLCQKTHYPAHLLAANFWKSFSLSGSRLHRRTSVHTLPS